MANNENLIPFSKRSVSEARELGRKGGKASGKSRRQKANFRQTLNMLLTTEIENDEWGPILDALGVDATLESAMMMAMIKEAIGGNVKAAYFVAQYAGQSAQTDADLEEQQIRTDRARRAREQETGDGNGAEENIRDFLKAMHPTEEDLANLFEGGPPVDEGGEDGNGKETEAPSEV